MRAPSGVLGLSNLVRVRPGTKVNPGEVKHQIFEAFRRSAELEARRIGIDAKDGKVVLHGNVHDWSEVDAAGRTAWAVPGVTEVENRLSVVP